MVATKAAAVMVGMILLALVSRTPSGDYVTSDVALSTITVSRMGTLIAPANPMIVSTNANMTVPPVAQ
jgi:hypothetical protein